MSLGVGRARASPEFTVNQYRNVLPGMQAAAAKQIADLVEESG